MTATRLVNGVFVPDLAERPFGLPYLITTTVDLPMPPSVNRLWRAAPTVGGQPRVYLGPEYVKWKKEADWRVMANGTFRGATLIAGAFAAHIGLDGTSKTRGDLDNRAKAVLDWAQRVNLIADDKHCRRLTLEWVDHANAPDGCRLTLEELCA